MTRQLKVYGWRGMRGAAHPSPNGGRQTREIMAAHSVAEVLRIAGITRTEWNWSGGETGNDEELRVALADPGVVYWTELDGSYGSGVRDWRKA